MTPTPVFQQQEQEHGEGDAEVHGKEFKIQNSGLGWVQTLQVFLPILNFE